MLKVEAQQIRSKTQTTRIEKSFKNILVVGQEDHHWQLLAALPSGWGYTVLLCSSTDEPLNRIQESSIDFIVIDHFAPELDGLHLLEKIRQLTTVVPVLMISSQYDVEPYITAMNLGALDYFGKPIDYADIQRIVNTQNLSHSQTKRKYSAVLDKNY